MDACCKQEEKKKEEGCCEACPTMGCDGCACSKPANTSGCCMGAGGCGCGNR